MYFISSRRIPMKTTSFDVYDIILGDPKDDEDAQTKMGAACVDSPTQTVYGLFIEPECRGWGYAGRLLDTIQIDYPDMYVRVSKDVCTAMTLGQVIQWLQRRGMYVVNQTDSHVLLAPLKLNVRMLP